MKRSDLIDIMAQAIRETPDEDARSAAVAAALATGLRRALYMSYSLDARVAMVRRAEWLAKQPKT